MAQTLQTINLIAPGFRGLNTEESPLAQDQTFAAVAQNAIIDSYGRIAARKGNDVLTTTKTELGTDSIRTIHEFEDNAGNTVLFSTGNSKILSGTTTLVDETPAAYTINDDYWQIVNLNDACYFFNQDQSPLMYTNALGAVETMASQGGWTAPSGRTLPDGNTVCAAFGRLFVGDFSDDKSTVYWCDLLDPLDWTGGGSVDLSNVWPDGYDEIVRLIEHNNRLVIFGRRSIIIYSGASSPSSMVVEDTISGLGLAWRDGVVNIGSDLIFVSHDGLRSLGRTIQEESLPIGDLSLNVKKEFVSLIDAQNYCVRAVYSPENNFILVAFPCSNVIYCFDIRGTLENGAYRATRWDGAGFTEFYRSSNNDTLYIGGVHGIGQYSGYTDDGESYRFKYYSQKLDFGDSAKLKFLKKMRPTIIGGSSASVIFKWGYGFKEVYKNASVTLDSLSTAEFGVAEFGIAEFGSGVIAQTRNINTTGSGVNITIACETDINGSAFSLQEINAYILVGKTL